MCPTSAGPSMSSTSAGPSIYTPANIDATDVDATLPSAEARGNPRKYENLKMKQKLKKRGRPKAKTRQICNFNKTKLDKVKKKLKVKTVDDLLTDDSEHEVTFSREASENEDYDDDYDDTVSFNTPATRVVNETTMSSSSTSSNILPINSTCSRCDQELGDFDWRYCSKYGCIQIHQIGCYDSLGCSCTELQLNLDSSP